MYRSLILTGILLATFSFGAQAHPVKKVKVVKEKPNVSDNIKNPKVFWDLIDRSTGGGDGGNG